MTAVAVVSAFPAGRGSDAAALVFEYMAATQAETGRPVPADSGELPAVLQRECDSLHDVYRPRETRPRSGGSTSARPTVVTGLPAS
ncbi:MAG: hypothetical protein ABSA93_08955 [Streptosporangiaceae bacterium]